MLGLSRIGRYSTGCCLLPSTGLVLNNAEELISLAASSKLCKNRADRSEPSLKMESADQEAQNWPSLPHCGCEHDYLPGTKHHL
jgi:hypothetical protein